MRDAYKIFQQLDNCFGPLETHLCFIIFIEMYRSIQHSSLFEAKKISINRISWKAEACANARACDHTPFPRWHVIDQVAIACYNSFIHQNSANTS